MAKSEDTVEDTVEDTKDEQVQEEVEARDAGSEAPEAAEIETVSEDDEEDDSSQDDGEADAKVISKGKARLIISGAEEARDASAIPQPLAPEPRVVRVCEEEPEQEPEQEAEEGIPRLEREMNPGKERVKVDKAKFEERRERPDNAEREEAQWGSSISPGWWVAIAGACTAVILIGGLAMKNWVDGDQTQTVIALPPSPPSEANIDPYEGSPEKWFHDRAGTIGPEANAVLQAYISAKDDVSRSMWVRHPQAYLEAVKERQVILSPRMDNTEEQTWKIGYTGDSGFLVLNCRDTDFMPFRAYFVREGEQLKLDWKATMAWSDVPMKTMILDVKAHLAEIDAVKRSHREKMEAFAAAEAVREKAIHAAREQAQRKAEAAAPATHVVSKGENVHLIAQHYKITVEELLTHNEMSEDLIQIGQELKIPSRNAPVVDSKPVIVPPQPEPVPEPVFSPDVFSEPVLVRCMLRRRNEHYAGPYNDQEHSAFMLLSPDKSHSLWAYTPRDSDLDIELRRLLDHGRFVVSLKKDVRVTLRVRRNKKDALPSQLELVEIVHPEWVTP